MPETPPPTEDLDAIHVRATHALLKPEDATATDTYVLARIALDFVALTKKHAALEKQYAELSQTSELRRSHAILQKDYVELAESKTQTIKRCSELLEENRRLHRIVFPPSQARSLAHALQIWAREVEVQLLAHEEGLTDLFMTEGEGFMTEGEKKK